MELFNEKIIEEKTGLFFIKQWTKENINYTLANKNKNTPNISAPHPGAFFRGKKEEENYTPTI